MASDRSRSWLVGARRSRQNVGLGRLRGTCGKVAGGQKLGGRRQRLRVVLLLPASRWRPSAETGTQLDRSSSRVTAERPRRRSYYGTRHEANDEMARPKNPIGSIVSGPLGKAHQLWSCPEQCFAPRAFPPSHNPLTLRPQRGSLAVRTPAVFSIQGRPMRSRSLACKSGRPAGCAAQQSIDRIDSRSSPPQDGFNPRVTS